MIKKLLLKLAGSIINNILGPQDIWNLNKEKNTVIIFKGIVFKVKECTKISGVNMPSELIIECKEAEIPDLTKCKESPKTIISPDDLFFLITALQSGGIKDMETLSGWVNRRLPK